MSASRDPDTAGFADRTDAGRRLAEALLRFKDDRTVVLGLPRGGVPVAFEVAQALGAPLGVLLVRKIGAPGYPELGLGAVVDGAEPEIALNREVLDELRPASAYLKAEIDRQLAEIEKRRKRYGAVERDPAGRTVIVVDDGVATGGSMLAALRALRRRNPARIVAAIPVAPRETIEALAAEADEVVCLIAPEAFGAVGAYYSDFSQTSDEEVVDLLRRAG